MLEDSCALEGVREEGSWGEGRCILSGEWPRCVLSKAHHHHTPRQDAAENYPQPDPQAQAEVCPWVTVLRQAGPPRRPTYVLEGNIIVTRTRMGQSVANQTTGGPEIDFCGGSGARHASPAVPPHPHYAISGWPSPTGTQNKFKGMQGPLSPSAMLQDKLPG